MENSSQNIEHIHLDDNRSYCLFYIDGEQIRLSSNFKTEEDMIELLNVIRNTDVALEIISETLSEIDAAQLRAILDAIKNKREGKNRPVISPLSMSHQK